MILEGKNKDLLREFRVKSLESRVENYVGVDE
jgi:hypothetical protein